MLKYFDGLYFFAVFRRNVANWGGGTGGGEGGRRGGRAADIKHVMAPIDESGRPLSETSIYVSIHMYIISRQTVR